MVVHAKSKQKIQPRRNRHYHRGTLSARPRRARLPGRTLHLASLRYDLAKLRAKGLVAKLPHSRRYQLLPQGYSICLIFLKLFERVYTPLIAGLLSPVGADRQIDQLIPTRADPDSSSLDIAKDRREIIL
jgi:hypothetical protein